MADPASAAEAGGDDAEKTISSRNKVEGFLNGLPENVRARVEQLRSLQSRIDEAMKEWDKQEAAMAAAMAAMESTAAGGATVLTTTAVVADPSSQGESIAKEPKKESPNEICPDSVVDFEKVIEDLYRERLELITAGGGVEGDEGSSPGPKEDAFPPFWSTAMSKCALGQFISLADGEVLKNLRDIRCKVIDDVDIDRDDESDGGKDALTSSSKNHGKDERGGRRRPRRPHSFTLEFVFHPNEYFTNEVLSKTFYVNGAEDDPKVWKVDGTKIDWKEGRNLCVSKRSRSRIRALWKSVWNDGEEEKPNCVAEPGPKGGPGAEPESTAAPGSEPGSTAGPEAVSGAEASFENSDSFKSFWTASFGDCGAVDEDDWKSFFDFFGPIFVDFPPRPVLYPPTLPPIITTNSDGTTTTVSRPPHPNSFVTTITYTGTTVTLSSVMDNKTKSDHEDTNGTNKDGEKVDNASATGSGDDCKVFQVRGVTYELDKLRDRLLDHYIIGLAIKDNLIPRAVHWYTGEAVEDDDEDEEEDEDFD
ncbi:hypothetical protein CBR_g41681 [Chara braunii]|uniref:Nucleosome assembly protein n=1 Tax=Chara braunii TaxID=69332 RepID=A0A388LWB1_CHABU|nr:hypothetical protein CBR_g41681 [Chara braunii]|eukprot:GBG86617.1 hypothetical protein CBR_g41681 [Chara braunii]